MSKWQQGKKPTGFQQSGVPATTTPATTYPAGGYDPKGTYWNQWSKPGTKTTAVSTCKPHQEWFQIGNEKENYGVWLKSSGGYIHKGVDIFIDLATVYNVKSIPPDLLKYLPQGAVQTRRISYEITDGKVDPYVAEFVLNMLRDGLKLGWGCIGGHGRTGWVAAKVHQLITGCSGDEAVQHIRGGYCEEAIETQIQLDNLGAKVAKPSKSYYAVTYVQSYKACGFDPPGGV